MTIDNRMTTIREAIELHARVNPGASFLINAETGRVLTFGELERQSILIANDLREKGLQRGDKVAFLMDNGLFTAQLFLGVMYGGFVVVPLNVRAGVSQLSYTLDHCDAQAVCVSPEYRALFDEVVASVPRPIQMIPAEVDAQLEGAETPERWDPLLAPEPEDPSLLMYTSGSTGQSESGGSFSPHRAGARNKFHSRAPA